MSHWLLEVTIDGRVYRWSEFGVTVDDGSGSLTYAPGLQSLEAREGEQAVVTVSDPSVDWSTLGRVLEGSDTVLRRWQEDTDFSDATVYAIGECSAVEWGSRADPVSWDIAQVAGAKWLGQQMPDPLARMDSVTWPLNPGTHSIGGRIGALYPVIFGYPGYVGEVTATIAVVPVPIGQWEFEVSQTYAIVCEDGDQQITSVFVWDDDLEIGSDEDVSLVVDNLGRRIRVSNWDNGGIEYLPSSVNSNLFAGFSPFGGGGPRSLYDVTKYVLERWGTNSVDWSRLPEVRDLFDRFSVDTWIDKVQSDPWAWLEFILGDLPVEIRTGNRGRYIVPKRFRSEVARQTGSLNADDGQCARVSNLRRDGTPVNEWLARYRHDRKDDGVWHGQVILTGDPETVPSAPSFPVGEASQYQSIAVASSEQCLESISRWGLRQNTDPVEIDWSWDTGTVLACLQWRAERYAVPGILVDYEISNEELLREGDEVLLTDSEVGLDGEPAIVEQPPTRGGPDTHVIFRIPGLR